jgi:hypothetical protein
MKSLFALSSSLLILFVLTSCSSESEQPSRTEKEINVAELPEAVVTAIKARYPDCTITEADAIRSETDGDLFEVEITTTTSGSEVKREMLLDPQGKILSDVVDDENEDDDEVEKGAKDKNEDPAEGNEVETLIPFR